MQFKILERLIYNKMFKFFTESELISHNQPNFKPEDFCIDQLLRITNDIYQSLDDGLETRHIFFDILKAFDKVWQDGLLYMGRYVTTMRSLMVIDIVIQEI